MRLSIAPHYAQTPASTPWLMEFNLYCPAWPGSHIPAAQSMKSAFNLCRANRDLGFERA